MDPAFYALWWAGNLAGEFDSLAEAKRALAELVAAEPAGADDAGIVPCDSQGRPIGEPIVSAA
jgi:hypothetical protein